MSAAERILVAVLAAGLAAGGISLFVLAARPPRARRPAPARRSRVSTGTVAVALAAALGVLVVTRWVVASLATAVLVLVWSGLFQSVAATRERRRVDAIAKWLEDLRDLQRGSNLDLTQALERSAVRAPKEIAPELARFTERLRHHTALDEALLALAAELDHPTSDLAIAAMLFAHGHASGSVLYDTFEELAVTARDELTARDQIDRLRARFESSMRRMLAILAALVAYLLIASGETLDEYRTPAGQVYLVLPIAIWGTALWWLRRLSRYERHGRYLDYAAVSARVAGRRDVTLLQLALVASITAGLAAWCLVRALSVHAPAVATVYRRLYGSPTRSAPVAAAPHWERPVATLGRLVAGSAGGEQWAEARRYQLRVSDVRVATIATRTITATFVGFLATVIALALPLLAGADVPWWLAVAAPFAVALFTGYYQYTAIVATLGRRYAEFRGGVAAYVALVSVCLTTRRSAAEAVTYAADVGEGRAFEAIAAAVHAAPQMGLQAWEALDAVGVEYGARELEDLASSIANVSSIGVGVESTVVAVAARMRQVALDDMQRQADRQTATMFGPTMLFVLGTVAFLAYPLAQRVLDAFSTTS